MYSRRGLCTTSPRGARCVAIYTPTRSYIAPNTAANQCHTDGSPTPDPCQSNPISTTDVSQMCPRSTPEGISQSDTSRRDVPRTADAQSAGEYREWVWHTRASTRAHACTGFRQEGGPRTQQHTFASMCLIWGRGAVLSKYTNSVRGGGAVLVGGGCLTYVPLF